MQDLKLNELEISAIGEIANISIGNAATSLSLLVNREVDISTPLVKIKDNDSQVSVSGGEELVAYVDYVKGIMGRNMLFAKKDEVKMLADMMMGADGHGMFYDMDFSDMHLSAFSELMNQIMGAASTAMGMMLDRLVDISTPEAIELSDGKQITYDSSKDNRYVEVLFDVVVNNEMQLKIIQAYPFILAKAIADVFLIKKGTMDKN